MKTSELNEIGLTSRQIKTLQDNEIISKILTNHFVQDGMIIARLFPEAVIFLENALFHYEYTDRVPSSWQIAFDKDSEG